MDDGVGFLIVGVPIGVFLQPGMVPGGVVSYPVKDDAHAVLMADIGEVLEVVDGAELGSDSLIVADAVWGVLSFLDTDGVYGHHPHDVHAQVSDRVDAGCDGIE